MATNDDARRAKHVWTRRLTVRPGDRIPFGGVDVLVVTAGGAALSAPVDGGGAANPYCAESPARTWTSNDEDRSENGASIGLLFTYGSFRMLDLADLTWNREIALMCPSNPIGTVDLFMVSHHGHGISNSPALVKALRPRVTIMNNGERKIGAAAVVGMLRALPGVEANYQLHWSANAGNENPPDANLANLAGGADGHWLEVAAEASGRFTVTNARTRESRTFGR